MLYYPLVGKRPKLRKEKAKKERKREGGESELCRGSTEGAVIMMPRYCRRPSFKLLVQAFSIIACLCYYSATLVVVAQEAEVGNPCLICPYGATEVLDDYAPFASLRIL
jgi:hypothetical protein